MVQYSTIQTSNSQVGTSYPAGLVAVFVGGTNGIGEYTLLQFAQHAKAPRVYFYGRSTEAGSRIKARCERINPEGTFTFIKTDASLIKNVDTLCKELKEKEQRINVLFLSIGTLDFYSITSEGLKLALALQHYARARIIYNLLPELRAATGLKRVVSVFTGTKEGPIFIDDLAGDKIPLTKQRGHAASIVTLGMEALAKMAPDVSFIHTFPGPVKSGIGRDMRGVVGIVVRGLSVVVGPLFNIAEEKSGAYHLFFATSERYPAAKSVKEGGVLLLEGVTVARGIDGKEGSGMYCINQWGESANASIEELLAGFRKDGTAEKVWKHTEEEWRRIVGE